MADYSAVETAIVGQIVAALYPNGTGSASIIGPTCSVERGWPTEADLRSATGSGTQLIRVFAIPGMSKDAERYPRIWQTLSQATPTLTITQSGQTFTLGGTVTAAEIVVLKTTAAAYTYVVQVGDTLSMIAAALAAEITGASSSGASVTVPSGGLEYVGGVFSPGTAELEVGRQVQMFSVTVWATTPAYRDAIGAALTAAFAQTYRLTLSDGTIATRVGSSLQIGGPQDLPSRAQEWRRDYRIAWDYGLTVIDTFAPAAAIEDSIAPANGVAVNIVT